MVSVGGKEGLHSFKFLAKQGEIKEFIMHTCILVLKVKIILVNQIIIKQILNSM